MDKARAPETMAEFDEYLREHEHQYRQFFKDRDQYEFFMMLPMDDALRHSVLAAMSSEVAFTRELDSCRGCVDSTHIHRLACIKCVNVHRSSIAKPFYE